MSRDEVHSFLSEGTRTGKLGTVRPDGSPHVAPIWFVVDDDGTIVFNTGSDTVKGKALQRDNRATVCVDDESPPFSYVRVDGTVVLSRDLDEMLPWATRIAARYMGEDEAEAYGKRNAVEGEMLVRLHPTKIVSRKDVAD